MNFIGKEYSSSLNLNTTFQTTTVAPFLAWRGSQRNAHLRQTAEADFNLIYRLCKDIGTEPTGRIKEY